MDLQYYLEIFWRRKWIIVITVLMTEIVVMIGTFKTVPTYSATTTMRIASASSGSVTSYDYMYADRLMNTYVKLATTKPVLDTLKQQLGLSKLPSIEVKTVSTTELIQITVEHRDPKTAALAANTMANILIDQSLELYTGSGESSLEILGEQVSSMELEVNQARTEYTGLVAKTPEDTEGIQSAKQMLDLKQQMYATILEQYEQTRLKESLRANMISVVEPAIAPDQPAKPRKVLNIALGFMVGVVGGVGLAFLFENIDSTLQSSDQIEAVTKLPSIGKIPELVGKNSLINVNNSFAYQESFHRLRAHILSAEFPVHTLVITSAEPRDGKSRIAADLAHAMAQSGRDVVLVDGDLRAPVQHKLFNIENNIGLSNILEQKTDYLEALQWCEDQGVHVLPSGPIPANPSELLGSNQMKLLIDQLSNNYDMVIIDTPAGLVVTDAVILAPIVDAVALVVCRGKSSSSVVKTLLAQVNTIKVRWIGIIINRAKLNRSHYYYNHKKENKNIIQEFQDLLHFDRGK